MTYHNKFLSTLGHVSEFPSCSMLKYMYINPNIPHFDFIHLLIDIWVIINDAMNMCVQIVSEILFLIYSDIYLEEPADHKA